jgi:hypothetical protein
MNVKWIVVVIVVAALGIALWGSDKITYEGERTIYTVRCEQGTWAGLQCMGRMIAADRPCPNAVGITNAAAAAAASANTA